MADGDTPAIASTVGVAVVLAEHWDALDYDFRHELGLDLEACCFGPDHIGVRRLRAYITQLPPNSAFARETGRTWTTEREMLATLIELGVNQHRRKKTDPLFKYPRPKGPLEEPSTTKPPLTRQGMRAALLGGR